MKKPTPRLRQVFEHETHFKVINPLGHPTVIAKNGLSDGLKSKLRKFADGGEVTSANPNEEAINILESAKAGLFPSGSSASEPESDGLPDLMAPAAEPPGAEESPFGVLPADVEPAAAAIPAAPTASSMLALNAPVSASDQEAPAAISATQPAAILPEPSAPTAMPAAEDEEAKLIEKLPPEVQGIYRTLRATDREVLANAEKEHERQGKIIADQMKLAQDSVNRAKQVQQDAWNEFVQKGQQGQSLFSRMNTPQKIGLAASIILGGIGSGLTGRPNAAAAVFERAIRDDLERQQEDRKSYLNRFIQAGIDVKQAETMVRAFGEKALAMELTKQSGRVTDPIAKRNALKMAYDIYQTGVLRESQANAAAALTEVRRIEAQQAPGKFNLETRRVENEERRIKIDFMKYQLEHSKELRLSKKDENDLAFRIQELDLEMKKAQAASEKQEEEKKEKAKAKTFNAGGVFVPTTDPTIARKADSELLGITDYANTVKRLHDLLQKHPAWSQVGFGSVGSDEYQQVKGLVAKALETFPKSARFQRALNVTASRVIKEGATGNIQGVMSYIGGNPELVAKELLRDAVEAYVAGVTNYADPRSDEAKEQVKKAINQFKNFYLPDEESKGAAGLPRMREEE